jgi:Na+-transporting NADH:ubiquinone oxidoreductase subunit A
MDFARKKGLDLPLAGKPIQTIEAVRPVTSVAILGNEYTGMKPTMLVEQGQAVKLGQALFTDKKNPRVTFTSPGSGIVKNIKRGSKRSLQAVILELEGNDEVNFQRYDINQLDQLNRDDITQNLLDSGLWTMDSLKNQTL